MQTLCHARGSRHATLMPPALTMVLEVIRATVSQDTQETTVGQRSTSAKPIPVKMAAPAL